MAFKWETQWDSPNYTPASQAQATWGRPRTIEAIAIHWWGDPNQGPTYEGVIATLCNPNRGASAHIVATGTGRRAACLVNLTDASWATNSANPYTISIECDPRCRDEDYDVVGEVIAQLRAEYGNLPLVPHRQFVSTQCPGNYDLDRLNRVANSKLVTKQNEWGDVKNKESNNVAIIQNADNWWGRLNKLHLQVLGRPWGNRSELAWWAGKDILTFVEQISDSPEAQKALDWQTVGEVAVRDNWQQQIADRTKERDTAAADAQKKGAELSEAQAEVERLKAELASKGTESPSNGSGSESGTETQPGNSGGSQTLWEWLGELLSKFKRSK